MSFRPTLGSARSLSPVRLRAMERLVAEEAAVEDEQRERERTEDRRGFRKRKPETDRN